MPSLKALNFLRQQGFKYLKSVKGGITAGRTKLTATCHASELVAADRNNRETRQLHEQRRSESAEAFRWAILFRVICVVRGSV